MKNYSITIGYKAVIEVSVKANSPEEAKEKGLEDFKKQKSKMFQSKNVALNDDSFGAHGIVDMDETWNIL